MIWKMVYAGNMQASKMHHVNGQNVCWGKGGVGRRWRLSQKRDWENLRPKVFQTLLLIWRQRCFENLWKNALLCRSIDVLYSQLQCVLLYPQIPDRIEKRHAGARLPQGRTIRSMVLLECFHGFSQPLSGTAFVTWKKSSSPLIWLVGATRTV